MFLKTAGTVLSLNGHRRYFCMYHAKHPEASRRPGYYTSSGAFMGFDSENDSSDIEVIFYLIIFIGIEFGSQF